ncbi:MAG: FtsX-like permease family protein, partial [Chloroflexota bacterium]|nr:FtsX-like permease family protein [Chloroflexota bacterium]
SQEVPAEALVPQADSVLLASPSVTLLGVRWRDLEEFGSTPPSLTSLPTPSQGEAYVSTKLAKVLELHSGSRLRLHGPERMLVLRVAGVVPEDGVSGYSNQFTRSEGTLLTNIDEARKLLDAGPADVNTLFISNAGGPVDGAQASDPIAETVQALLKGKAPEGSQFAVIQAKAEALDSSGDEFGSFFLILSSLSILAGILLIVNIYIMLAEERKAELGTLRAVALERSALVRLFVYEGYAYSLCASIVGAWAGVAIAAGMLWGFRRLSGLIEEAWGEGFSVVFYATPSSLVIAASVGLLITFVTVLFTSIRISRLNIVTAIRDLPEQKPLRRTTWRLLLQVLLLLVGLVLTGVAFMFENAYLMFAGPCISAFGLAFLLSHRVSGRLVWTVAAVSVLAYSYTATAFAAVVEAQEDGPAWTVLAGVFMVVAAVVLTAYNLGVISWVLQKVIRRLPSIAPVFRVAFAYPMARRGRTGLTLAMFSLVLYIVTILSIMGSTLGSELKRTSGAQLSGYDGALVLGPATPIEDFEARIRSNSVLQAAIDEYAELRHSQVELPAYRASEYVDEWNRNRADVPQDVKLRETVTFLPSNYADATTEKLEDRLPEYGTDREAWQALVKDPSLVLVTSAYSGKVDYKPRPEVRAGTTIVLKDPVSGAKVTKRVIGRIGTSGGFDSSPLTGIVLGDAAMSNLPGIQTSTQYLIRLARGADAAQVNRELRKEFVTNGAQTFMVVDMVGTAHKLIGMWLGMVQAFLAFGLLVGVAGLAVISARAVHERRRDIGTQRAVGFDRSAVRWQFILESSFVALLGIAVGTGVGALGGLNLMKSFADAESSELQFVFPWIQLSVIGLGVWLATLLFTVVPAVRAARTPPVDALRYHG